MGEFWAPGAEIWLFKKKNMDRSIHLAVWHIQIISKNLQATCIVTVSSSAPRRPGTSARHWRGRPWSLQFQVNIYKVFLKKDIYNLWLHFKVFKYFSLHQYSSEVWISHYMSGLYCLKLDHFQMWAESKDILISIYSILQSFLKFRFGALFYYKINIFIF